MGYEDTGDTRIHEMIRGIQVIRVYIGYVGYKDTWDTRIQGYVGYKDTRIQGIQEYVGYKDTRIQGIQGYVDTRIQGGYKGTWDDTWDTRIQGICGIQVYMG